MEKLPAKTGGPPVISTPARKSHTGFSWKSTSPNNVPTRILCLATLSSVQCQKLSKQYFLHMEERDVVD